MLGSFLHGWAGVSSSVSSMLRYSRNSQTDSALGVRVRTPRLFANSFGRDLLVEYIDGENAGKAILSRIRTGLHLGEGYVYHVEEAHLKTSKAASQADLASASLIIMVTSARILLLSGDRDETFCTVLWETCFESLISVEVDEFENAYFDELKLWHLVDAEHATGNVDDRLTQYKGIYGGNGDFGLDILICKSVFVPQRLSKTLQEKIIKVHVQGPSDGHPIKHSDHGQ